MRKTNEQSLKEVINELMGDYQMQDKLTEVNVIGHWEEIAGSLIARQTEIIYINKRRLFLQIASPALRQELNYSRSKLIEIVNAWAKTSLIDEVVIK